jgi:hypothetical protein
MIRSWVFWKQRSLNALRVLTWNWIVKNSSGKVCGAQIPLMKDINWQEERRLKKLKRLRLKG